MSDESQELDITTQLVHGGERRSLPNGKPVSTPIYATADFSDVAGLREKARELRPRVMIAETISNPLLKVCDIDVCAELAREVGARLIIDNTFATPYLCQPLKHGADMVVHSATKYLGGHADAMAGLAVSRDELDATALIGVMKLVGGGFSPWEAHEILRGMKK